MKLSQTFRMAGKSILGSKLRSFLTMLGMIIGVASVIVLVGIMNGLSNYIVGSFSDLGTNLVSVSVTNIGTRKAEVDDMYQIVTDYKDLFQAVSPMVTSQYKVKKNTDSLTTTVKGVGEDYMEMQGLHTSWGRFIRYGDIKERSNICVIGSYIAQELFDGKVSQGSTIKINGQLFTIVGIQTEKAKSKENTTDDCIYIPYSTASRMSGISDISSFSFSSKDVEKVNQCEKILDVLLYNIFKDEDLYTITSMTELLDMVESMTGMLSSILSGIAGISLLVAGIGIMNIMLVSVVERTKEIGIRKSLGAKKRDIRLQFVIEAAVIGTLGGVIGIIIGSIGTVLLGNVLGVEAFPDQGSIILAFSVSAGIGICFGYMPANKAAKLNPIDALRNE